MTKARRTYHHGSLAHDAIAATAREIDRHGHQGFTLQKVAKRLGVTPAALYRHYENREALLKAFVLETFKRFAAEMDDTVTRANTPAARVLALGDVYVRFALANPGWFRLQFSQAGIALGIEHEREVAIAYPALILEALAALLGSRRRPAEHAAVERAYLSCWALMHGVAGLALEGVWAHLTTDEARIKYARELMRAHVDMISTP